MIAARAGTVRGLAVLGGGTALAAVLGLGFQSLLAYWFGAGAETDALFMSLSIYGFLGKFLMLSHLRSLALPVYARLRGSDPEAARRLAGGLLGLTLAGVTVLSIVLFAVAPVLVDLLAPGYDGALRDLTVLLVRIRVPALVFLAGTTVAMAFLESEQRFGVTISAQKVVPAAVALALLLVAADRYGIVAAAWIGLASTVAGALLILPIARGRIGSPALAPAARDDQIRAVGRRWLGLSSSNAATFVGEWAFRVGASLLPAGLFSAVLYGRMVHDLLHAGINDSAQTMVLPRLSAALARDGEIGAPLRASLTALGAVSLPLTLLVAATAHWGVALLFGRGRFLADGMLEPAAVSLALFMIGFFLQGVVQILFSAAFASHRSDLVNRTQLIGHLARAATLVPMVIWFSYVGLVGSQIAMNALVLGLLLAWSPREWGLAELRSRLLRRIVAAAVPAGLYLGWLAPRLPEPLSLGTLGRLAVMSAIGLGWLIVYGAAASALGLPEARALLARVRRRAAITAAIVLGIAVPGAASAQTASWSPIGEGHWSLRVLEWMEARGAVPAGSFSVRPLPGALVGQLLGPGEMAERLDEERARGLSAALGFRVRDRPEGSVLRPVVRLEAGTPSSIPFGFVELERSTLIRGGLGVRAGKLWAAAARERVQLGGGATGAIALNPSAHLDGLTVGLAEPITVPLIGTLSLVAAAGPLRAYEAVENPWWGYLRATAGPTPWMQIGLARVVLAGGHFRGGRVPFDPRPYGSDQGSLGLADVPALVLGRNTDYDDQVIAMDIRGSWSEAGLPLLTYAELGWEELDRSWGDPALLAGALLALTDPLPMALRYEYTAFGRRARICGWCDTLPAFWYQHVRFQSGWRAGDELLGHPLGGYGHQHSVISSVWTHDAKLRAELRLTSLARERWNLLEQIRPGSASRVEATASWRAHSRLDLSGSFVRETGEDWRLVEWEMTASALF